MAHEAKKSTRELDRVRVPARFVIGVQGYVDYLKMQILEGAARRANKRTKGATEKARICLNDVLQAAQESFSDSINELEQVLTYEMPVSRLSRIWKNAPFGLA